mmetsp:Transcript_122024/g.350597  ORF Transcript_122024/g.350597 Transcript_122024/m.350597 type:complete len:202 (-) Transcript_122024:675-1280(-)
MLSMRPGPGRSGSCKHSRRRGRRCRATWAPRCSRTCSSAPSTSPSRPWRAMSICPTPRSRGCLPTTALPARSPSCACSSTSSSASAGRPPGAASSSTVLSAPPWTRTLGSEALSRSCLWKSRPSAWASRRPRAWAWRTPTSLTSTSGEAYCAADACRRKFDFRSVPSCACPCCSALAWSRRRRSKSSARSSFRTTPGTCSS